MSGTHHVFHCYEVLRKKEREREKVIGQVWTNVPIALCMHIHMYTGT